MSDNLVSQCDHNEFLAVVGKMVAEKNVAALVNLLGTIEHEKCGGLPPGVAMQQVQVSQETKDALYAAKMEKIIDFYPRIAELFYVRDLHIYGVAGSRCLDLMRVLSGNFINSKPCNCKRPINIEDPATYARHKNCQIFQTWALAHLPQAERKLIMPFLK